VFSNGRIDGDIATSASLLNHEFGSGQLTGDSNNRKIQFAEQRNAEGRAEGLWSLIIALGWIERSFRNIVIALGVVFFYGGMVFGVLPTAGFISFESHLFGAIAGIITAIFLERNRKLVTETTTPRPSLKFGKSRRIWRFSLRRRKHR